MYSSSSSKSCGEYEKERIHGHSTSVYQSSLYALPSVALSIPHTVGVWTQVVSGVGWTNTGITGVTIRVAIAAVSYVINV